MDTKGYALYLGLDFSRSRKDRAVFAALKPALLVELPEGWKCKHDPKLKRVYFEHSGTGITQFEHPLE